MLMIFALHQCPNDNLSDMAFWHLYVAYYGFITVNTDKKKVESNDIKPVPLSTDRCLRLFIKILVFYF